MALESKHVFIGCGAAAAILTVGVVVVAGLAYATVTWLVPMAEDLELQASLMPEPRFPTRPSDYHGTADYSWTVRTLDGGSLDMGRLRGEVVLLNVWATWCGPCRAEMPSIQRLHDTLADDGVRFVLVSDEDTSILSRFMTSKSFTFPVYSAVNGMPAVFRTDAIPTTFILSRDGDVVLRHVGSARWDGDGTVAFLRSLLAAGQTL